MSIPEVIYEKSHPSQVPYTRATALRNAYYPATLKGRVKNSSDIGQFLRLTTPETWNDPNKNPMRRSRRARPFVVTATDGDSGDLLGFLRGSDDASSPKRLPGQAGFPVEWAKLHVPIPRLLRSRFLTITEVIAPNDERFIPDVLGAIATASEEGRNDYHDLRPVSCYPWEPEEQLIQLLSSWGMEPLSPDPETVPLAPGAGSIGQYAYRISSIEQLHANILKKPGVAVQALPVL